MRLRYAGGNYFLSELPVGAYDVSATWSGFAPRTVKGVQVDGGGPRAIQLAARVNF